MKCLQRFTCPQLAALKGVESLKFRVKYFFALPGMILVFVTLILFCIIDDTSIMNKDEDGTSVYLRSKKLTKVHLHVTLKKLTRGDALLKIKIKKIQN